MPNCKETKGGVSHSEPEAPPTLPERVSPLPKLFRNYRLTFLSKAR